MTTPVARIHLDTRLTREDTAGILEAFVEGLKDGVLTVHKSGETLELDVPRVVDLDVSASRSSERAVFTIEVSWRTNRPDIPEDTGDTVCRPAGGADRHGPKGTDGTHADPSGKGAAPSEPPAGLPSIFRRSARRGRTHAARALETVRAAVRDIGQTARAMARERRKGTLRSPVLFAPATPGGTPCVDERPEAPEAGSSCAPRDTVFTPVGKTGAQSLPGGRGSGKAVSSTAAGGTDANGKTPVSGPAGVRDRGRW